ncbi:MAG: hypothetical protein ACE5IR_24945, partial [bacterium]
MIKKFTAILLISAYMIGCKSIVSDDASQSEIAESVLRISSEFTTDKQVYKSGETVILHLENISDQYLGYNLCSAVLEQKKGSSWHAMPS